MTNLINMKRKRKKVINVFISVLFIHAFFSFGELRIFQCVYWSLGWGCHKDIKILKHLKKGRIIFNTCQDVTQVFIWVSFSSGVRSFNTFFEHTLIMFKFLCTNVSFFINFIQLSSCSNSQENFLKQYHWWFFKY